MAFTSVDHNGSEFIITCKQWDNARAKACPDRKFDSKNLCWRVPATNAAARYIEREYSAEEKTESTVNAIRELLSVASKRKGFPGWFRYKTTPRKHQAAALDYIYGLDEAALFMEMRTGKSYVTIVYSSARAMEGHINGLIVICPNSIRMVWDDEFKEHCPIPYQIHHVTAGKAKATEKFLVEAFNGLKVMVVAVESLSQGGAADLASRFLATHKVGVAIDESSRIKEDQAARTEKCYNLGGDAIFRLILTGTPVTQGIHDLYSQFRFLNWRIIGMKSFFTFRNRYCIMGGFDNRKITGYQNVGELMDLIRPYTFQVQAKDVMDLPKRIPQIRSIEPTPQQLKAFKELGDPFEMITKQGDKTLEVETVLERMTRWAQISGGLFPFDDEEGGHGVVRLDGRNPKLDEMMTVFDELPKGTKVIIWARFRPEIELIVEALKKKYGDKDVAELHGGLDREDRKAEYDRFRFDPECTKFVVNVAVGSMGLELAVASVHMFYSRSFSYEDQKQAEARTNSSKQKAESILYVDFVLNTKIDKMTLAAYERKSDMAEFVKSEMEKDK